MREDSAFPNCTIINQTSRPPCLTSTAESWAAILSLCLLLALFIAAAALSRLQVQSSPFIKKTRILKCLMSLWRLHSFLSSTRNILRAWRRRGTILALCPAYQKTLQCCQMFSVSSNSMNGFDVIFPARDPFVRLSYSRHPRPHTYVSWLD